jgi:hypothetical protein
MYFLCLGGHTCYSYLAEELAATHTRVTFCFCAAHVLPRCQVGRLPSSTKSWTISLLLLRKRRQQQRQLAAMQQQEGEW